MLAGSGIVDSSSGAQISSNPPTGVDTTPETSTVETEPGTSGEATGTPADGLPADDLTDKTEPAPQSAGYSTTTSHQPSQTDSKPARDVEAGQPTAGISGTTKSVGQPVVDVTSSTAHAKLQAVEPNLARTTGNSASAVATLSAADSQPVTYQVAAAQQATTMTAPRIVTGLLAAFGLAPFATTNPLAPVAPPTLLGLLEWMRREINRIFFNQTPTMAYDPAENSLVDGSLVGKLTATDPDSPVLTFTATKPAHGDVTVDPDGTFTYTPDATFAGHDSFDVTVSDAGDGFQIHGFSGLINLVTFGLLGDRGDTYTRTISIGGFEASTVVSGLVQPTDFRLLPDGRILIVEKGGAIKATDKDGQLQSAPLITLPTPTAWARGLLAVEVDPDYQDNGHIYVSYVEPENSYQRLSRLTVTDPTAAVLAIDPDSEVVLVEGTQPSGNDHLGGGLGFGPDGKLYWSVGDNICCTVLDDGRNSQNLTNMYGKVLRLNRDGTAPADNPFYDGDDPNYDAIYATGFRNPFRLAFAPDGQLLVVDVGQATWEEVNLVTAGANYGWPNAEGPCNGIGTPSCATPSSYANPIYAYRHTGGGSSITAVMVYAGATSDSGQNTVLIADFNQGWVKELTFNSDYSSVISERLFEDAAPGHTNQLARDLDGNIYQLTFDGKLMRLAPFSDVFSTV